MKRNRIICIVALVLGVLLVIATNNAAALALTLLVAVAPVASAVIGSVLARRTKLTFELPASCVAGQVLEMEISVTRPRAMRSQIELVFECRNFLTGGVAELPVSLAPASGKTDTYLFAVPTASCGRTSIVVKSAHAVDPLGFAASSVPGALFESTYTVYPQLVDFEIDAAHAAHSSFTGTAYDHYRRGQDQSEVFEMRDFHDGDSLKSVHWKVSARLDELVVREASHPIDYDIALLSGAHVCQLDDTAGLEVMNACMAMCASVSLALVRKGLGHAVAFPAAGGLKMRYVDSTSSFEAMLDVMMTMPLIGVNALAAEEARVTSMEAFSSIERVSKAVIVCDVVDEDVATKVAQSTGLAIVHISADGATGMEDMGGYTLVHVPAADVYTRVKSLEL